MNRFERFIVKIAVKAEKRLSPVWGGHRTPEVIEPYLGYATPDTLILRGRVHSHLKNPTARFGQSRLRNVGQMLRRFMTAEVADAQVEAEGVTATSDEEGYFELRLPRNGRSGWVSVPVTLSANGHQQSCEAFAASARQKQIVISDIDDTVMKTGAYSLARNLWTSFTGNALTRQVFADSAVLMHDLHNGGQRPLYYVSSSPWNLHHFLQEIFARSAVIRGPMFLRDLGISETKLITDGHGNHKGQAIDTILKANPDCTAILIGDTGQEDASIYGDVIDRNPGRIAAVVLREPGPGNDDADTRAIAHLKESGLPVLHGPTFAGFAAKLEPQLAIPQGARARA